MEVLFIDLYFDNGTLKIVDDNLDTYCIDGRRETTTRGMVYLGYPRIDNSNLAPNQKKLKAEIKQGIIMHIIENPQRISWKPELIEMLKRAMINKRKK